MASTYVSKAPLTVVRLAGGQRVNVHKGGHVPASADPADVKRLVREGYLEKVTVVEPVAQPAPAPETSAEGTIKDVLAAVGEDPTKAAAALETEKAGENRTTLVSKLEAIVASGTGDGSDNGDGDQS